MIKEVSFKNDKKETLRGFVHIPKRYKTAIIFLHGFPAHCEYPGIKKICLALSWLGILTFRFNFSGTITSDGKFEEKLMSKEVKDTKYAVDFIKKKYAQTQIILIGHSTGAIDATLYAYKDKRIDKLILLGGVGNLKEAVSYDFTDEQIQDFKKKGYIIYSKKDRWTLGKKLKRAFYDEFFTLDVLGSLKKYKKPVLIIHGSKDKEVPVTKDPLELYKAANNPKKLIIIKGADHKFSKVRHGLQVLYHIWKFTK
jgi:uncharacterized protein